MGSLPASRNHSKYSKLKDMLEPSSEQPSAIKLFHMSQDEKDKSSRRDKTPDVKLVNECLMFRKYWKTIS
jgi:hypothetical protein